MLDYDTLNANLLRIFVVKLPPRMTFGSFSKEKRKSMTFGSRILEIQVYNHKYGTYLFLTTIKLIQQIILHFF